MRATELKPIRTITFATALVTLLLCACGDSQSEYEQRGQDRRLVAAIESRPESIDPRVGTSMASYRLQQLSFNYLVNQGLNGELVPELAVDWERELPEAGGEAITFTLRGDVRFHDGSPVTAGDVAYTFNTLTDDDFISRKKGAFADLEQVVVIDDLTVTFQFNRRQTSFLSNLPAVGILKAGSGTGAAPPIGSGPYIPGQNSGSEVFRFAANKDYFKGEPQIAELEIRVVPDNTTRVLEFIHGSVDLIINDLSSTDAEYIASLPGKKLVSSPGLAYQYIGINHRHELLADLAVREALALAIDRDALIEHFLGGLARKAESPMLPQLWRTELNLIPQRFDPVSARKLLDRAGYPDPDGDGPQPRFSLEFRCSNQRKSRELAAILKSMLRDVGVELKVRSSEWQTFYMDVVNGRYELYSLRWIGIIDPSFFAAVFHSSSIPGEDPPAGGRKRGSFNRGRYVNPAVDRYIETAENTLDEEERWRVYAGLQQLIDEDLPYIDLWYADNVAVMRNDLVGLKLSLNGNFAAIAGMRYTSSESTQSK